LKPLFVGRAGRVGEELGEERLLLVRFGGPEECR
jgi:hypothetical protein